MLCEQRPSMAAEPLQEVLHSVGLTVVGVPGGGQVKGLGRMFSKDLPQQAFSGDSEVRGGLGSQQAGGGRTEASVMGMVCSRCVAPLAWSGAEWLSLQ